MFLTLPSAISSRPVGPFRVSSVLLALFCMLAVGCWMFVPRSVFAKDILAFPGAEGFGRFASGGRGGDVYEVTSLDDSGPGSLREAIRSARGPRTIVFNLSGTIQLKKKLVLDKSDITIAG